jgi:hypothetical protein
VSFTAGAFQFTRVVETEPTVTIGVEDLTRDGLADAILCYVGDADAPMLHATVVTVADGQWVEALSVDLLHGTVASVGLVVSTESVTTPLIGCQEHVSVEYTAQAVPFHELERSVRRTGDCASLNEPPVADIQVCLISGGRVEPCGTVGEPFVVDTNDPDAELTVFSTSTDTDGTIVGYRWFIDGAPAGSEASFMIPIPDGGFELTLVVTDDQGAVAESTLQVEGGLDAPPVPSTGLPWLITPTGVGPVVLGGQVADLESLTGMAWDLDSPEAESCIWATLGEHGVAIQATSGIIGDIFVSEPAVAITEEGIQVGDHMDSVLDIYGERADVVPAEYAGEVIVIDSLDPDRFGDYSYILELSPDRSVTQIRLAAHPGWTEGGCT